MVDYFVFLSQYVEQVDLKTLVLPWPPSPEITSMNHGQPSQHYQNGLGWPCYVVKVTEITNQYLKIYVYKNKLMHLTSKCRSALISWRRVWISNGHAFWDVKVWAQYSETTKWHSLKHTLSCFSATEMLCGIQLVGGGGGGRVEAEVRRRIQGHLG